MPGTWTSARPRSVSVQEEARRWFDQFLKGEDKGILNEPAVKYFLMEGGNGEKNKAGRLQNGGRWLTADDLAARRLRRREVLSCTRMELSPRSPPEASEPSRFEFDPNHPVPTLGGNIDSGKKLIPRGAQNQTPTAEHPFAESILPLASRQDVLTFETSPLKEDLEVAGPIRVLLWVSSEAKDTDFTAKLIDVAPPSADYPSGYAMNIEDGILRMRFRGGRDHQEPMEPGEVYPVTIDLWATANLFRKGHRIRLDISSSNFPMYDVNPNTGEPLGRHTHLQKTLNTIYHDPRHPSRLVLSVRNEK